MTDPLFDYSTAADVRRIADALEGLLALLTARLPAAAPDPVPTPADAFAELTRNAPIGIALNDAQVGEEVLVKLTFAAPEVAPVKRKQAPRTPWSKLDPRSRELARLRTAAEHRAKVAKTAETRAAAALEAQQHHNESKNRQRRLRQWLDAGKGFIDGDAMYYLDADGTRVKFVPSPSPHFFLPY